MIIPIHPSMKDRYPKNWPAISKRIHFERAGNMKIWSSMQKSGPPRAHSRLLGQMSLWVLGESGHMGVCQAQEILKIPDPIEVPATVCRIPLARFGPCARVVLVGTEIHLTR